MSSHNNKIECAEEMTTTKDDFNPNLEDDITGEKIQAELRLPIVLFYKNEASCHGLTLQEILAWRDSVLEYRHDYIQILFPLPEASFFNYAAPILDEPTCDAFKSNQTLQATMRTAFARMLDFFGFSFDKSIDDQARLTTLTNISPEPEKFPVAASNWMNSHNDLRITRIIRCLRCCGLDNEAQSFYDVLQLLFESKIGFPRKISNRSFMYWTRAAKRDLRIPPDMSDTEAAIKLGQP